MKEMDDIENLFSSAFDGAEMAPPGAVKEGIDKSLFGGKANIGGYWWIGLIVIALIGGTALFFVNTAESEKETLAATTSERTMNGSDISGQSEVQKSENNGESANGQFTSTENEQTNAEQFGNGVSENARNGSTQQTKQSETQTTEVGSAEGFSGQNGTDEEPSSSFEPETSGDHTPTKESDNSAIGTTMSGDNIENATEKGAGEVSGDDGSGISTTETTADANNVFSDSMNDAEAGADETEKSSGEEFVVAVVNEMLTNPLEKLKTNEPEKSLLVAANPTLPAPPGVKSGGRYSLSLYSGMTYGSNSLKSDQPTTKRLQESVGFYSGLEVLYHLSSAYDVSLGLDYSQHKYSLTDELQTTSNVYVGDSLVLVFDTNQQVTDSLFYPMYELVSTPQEISSTIQMQSFGVPLYLTYNVPFGTSLSLRMGLGAHFSYTKYRVLTSDIEIENPEFKSFGLRVQLRPELVYNFNRFGIGVYGKLEYDVLQGMQWNAIKRRRWGTGAGISLRYKL